MKENAKKIIQKGVDEIIPYENNPRRNEKAIDKVANSIRSFGFQQPIIIDAHNIIICGHTRFEASKKLGLEKIPCIVAKDLTDAEIKAYRIADNKVAEFSEWDEELLEAELDGLEDFDMSEFGEFPSLGYEEIELPREDRGTSNQINSLKFGSIQIPMTEDEANAFRANMRNYLDENKTLFGFIGELLEK